MGNESLIEKNLLRQGLPIVKSDLIFIEDILMTVQKAEQNLKNAPFLNMEVPITVVDKELLT